MEPRTKKLVLLATSVFLGVTVVTLCIALPISLKNRDHKNKNDENHANETTSPSNTTENHSTTSTTTLTSTISSTIQTSTTTTSTTTRTSTISTTTRTSATSTTTELTSEVKTMMTSVEYVDTVTEDMELSTVSIEMISEESATSPEFLALSTEPTDTLTDMVNLFNQTTPPSIESTVTESIGCFTEK